MVGSAETLCETLPLVEETGAFVNVAVHNTPLQLNAALLGSERTLTSSSNAFYEDVREAYELIFSGQVSAGPMISHRLPLTEYERAFELLLSSPKQAYKVVFTPE